MMVLAYDYARCKGTDHEICRDCRRTEPGREYWQTHINPPIKEDGKCDMKIPGKKDGNDA